MKEKITVNGIEYELRGEQYYPILALPEQKPIGKWGIRHLAWLKRMRPLRYKILLGSGEINEYLFKVNEEAQERFDSLVLDFAEEYVLTEELKARDQMKWVQLANHIVKSAQEIVESELIYI